MYVWRNDLGVIGNIKALINAHNSNYANTENYHASDIIKINNNKNAVETAENAACELDENFESRLADIENALCELDEGRE